jgi:hypothetical protein
MKPAHVASRRLALKSLSLVLLGSGTLAGCATNNGSPEAEPVPPVIGSLTLLPVAMPDGVTLENRGMRGGLGLLMGGLGSLAASHSIRKNGERMEELIRARGVDLSVRLREVLLAEMAGAPVVPDLFADAQEAAKARENDDFKLLGVGSDAVLDITVNSYGFYCSSGVDDYTPQVYVSMGLRSPKTGDWLGDASYAYDRSPSKGYQRHFQTTAEHKFGNIDELFGESARAVTALETGVEKIAGAIAVDVRTILAGRFLA